MTLKELIKIASSAYPDDLVAKASEGDHTVSDGLAKFIAQELKETFVAEDKIDRIFVEAEQINTALRALRTAKKELQSVIERLALELKCYQRLG